MSPWEVVLSLSLLHWLGAPESKWWVVQRLQNCSLPLKPSCLASDRLVLSVPRWLWSMQEPCRYCLKNKRGYGMAVREWMGALAEMESTSMSSAYFQVGFLLVALVPREPLHQPEPASEVAKDTRSRAQRSGGDEASCRQWWTNWSHVVLHSSAP